MSDKMEELAMERGMVERKIRQRFAHHGNLARIDNILELYEESLVRRCAEIAVLPDEEFKRRFPDIWELWMHDDISSERAINMAILRHFGLGEKEGR